MRRPTITHLAEAAGVSVATVNRVLGGHRNVRKPTVEQVFAAAERIGFYGAEVIRQQIDKPRQKYRFSVILLQRDHAFYRLVAQSLRQAAEATRDSEIHLNIVFLEDLAPEHVAERIRKLGAGSDGVAVVSAEHPLVTDAIESLARDGVPVIGLISALSARSNVGYVGLDNWKVGRTAGWAFDNLCKTPGKIGILVGNHRYRCQELNEIGFRSYFREHSSDFTLLEPLSTFESSATAREVTGKLLAEHPDLKGLFISGGGITGALAAVRDSSLSKGIVKVGYELMDETKAALLDGTLTLLISHPIALLGQEAIAAMIRCKVSGPEAGTHTLTLPFEIYTSENV